MYGHMLVYMVHVMACEWRSEDRLRYWSSLSTCSRQSHIHWREQARRPSGLWGFSCPHLHLLEEYDGNMMGCNTVASSFPWVLRACSEHFSYWAISPAHFLLIIKCSGPCSVICEGRGWDLQGARSPIWSPKALEIWPSPSILFVFQNCRSRCSENQQFGARLRNLSRLPRPCLCFLSFFHLPALSGLSKLALLGLRGSA